MKLHPLKKKWSELRTTGCDTEKVATKKKPLAHVLNDTYLASFYEPQSVSRDSSQR